MRRRGVGSNRLESRSSEFSRLCLLGRERTSRLGHRGAATSLRPWRGVGVPLSCSAKRPRTEAGISLKKRQIKVGAKILRAPAVVSSRAQETERPSENGFK